MTCFAFPFGGRSGGAGDGAAQHGKQMHAEQARAALEHELAAGQFVGSD
jgi:hypothetical protein